MTARRRRPVRSGRAGGAELAARPPAEGDRDVAPGGADGGDRRGVAAPEQGPGAVPLRRAAPAGEHEGQGDVADPGGGHDGGGIGRVPPPERQVGRRPADRWRRGGGRRAGPQHQSGRGQGHEGGQQPGDADAGGRVRRRRIGAASVMVGPFRTRRARCPPGRDAIRGGGPAGPWRPGARPPTAMSQFRQSSAPRMGHTGVRARRPGPLLPRRAVARPALRRVVRHRRDLDRHLLPAELPGPHAAPAQRPLPADGRRRPAGRVPRLQAVPARRHAGAHRSGTSGPTWWPGPCG